MDAEPMVRRHAVRGLVALGDQESIELVEEIAATDPYRADFLDGRYIVREAAREALESQ
jgi:HEAT repeat protein